MFIKIQFLILSLLSLSNIMAADMPTIKTELRADLIKYKSNNNTGSGDSPNNGNKEYSPTRFTLPYARIDIRGKYSDTLSYRLKFRANSVNSLKKDSSVNGIDYAYIEQSLMDGLKLKLGKQVMYLGGWEASYSSKDSYACSLVCMDGTTTVTYRTGAGLFYNHKIHSVALHFTNNSFEQTNSKSFFYGAQYSANLKDGLIQPLVSYHADNGTAQKALLGGGGSAAPKFTNTWTSLGVRSMYRSLVVELDYLNIKYDPTTNAITDKDDNSNSIVFNTSYRYEDFKPIFKYAVSTKKVNAAKTYDRDDIAFALEFYPFERTDFNYHAAYTTQDTDYVAASSIDVKTSQLLVGFTGSF